MRFIILSVGLIFAGFLILGVFGDDYQTASIEATEFGDCYDYDSKSNPVPINCSIKIFDQVLFFGLVLALIIVGIIVLIKGIRGKWDNEVKPEDMVGPGGDKKPDNQ
ncbi:MAG: hypothetical protein RI100_03215 [Nitrosarchaeum sp.]|uniref:hypothetical protein n=1 Tax=Nitrosarchaeum sp. TaxID=2026886 RepID=UPI002DE297A8|nr:hypothetical protein [Nitrosarchaeum sp.]